MNLTTRERQRLGEIDRSLILEEPRLHRALARLSLRPLRESRIRHVLSAPLRRLPVRVGMVVFVLCAGMAALFVGAATGLVVVLVAGLLVGTLGPLAVCALLRRTLPPGACGGRPTRRRPMRRPARTTGPGFRGTASIRRGARPGRSEDPI